MKQHGQIYVGLLGEGTEVWRSVEADHIAGDVYRISRTNTVPDDEQWHFLPGDVVRCQPREFSDGTNYLVAVENAE